MEGDERHTETQSSSLIGEEDPGIVNGDSAITPLLLFSVFVSVCGFLANGSAMGYTSPVESAIMEDLDITVAEFSVFGSILSVGSLLGALASGKITDLIGRRGAMEYGWITISISQEVWSLDVGRFLIGASAGVTYYVVPIYIAEITPKNVRGSLVFLSQLSLSCGLVAMYFTGSVVPWRILVLIGIIPSLVQLFGVFFIPESPRFLAKQGHSKEFKIVLQCLRGAYVDISKESADIEDSTERLQQISNVNFFGLFKRKYAHALAVVFGLKALAGVARPSGVTLYASSLFKSAGFSTSIGPTIMAVIQIPSIAVGMYFIDRCGRRFMIMFSTVAMCFFCFLVGLMFLLKENDWLESVVPYLLVLGLWGYSASFSLGMSSIPIIIMSEIFPMNVKGSAGSLSVFVASGSVFISSSTFNFMTEWSYPGTFFILAALNAFAVLYAGKLLPETKGRTLEEIHASFANVLH